MVFLDWTKFLQRGKEGKNEWMNGRELLKTQTQQARCCSQAFGKTVAAFRGRLSCNSNSHTAAGTVQMNQLRTCTAGILAEINDSWLLENDLTSEEIYSSDFLKGFTGREPFEILPLQLRRRPQQKAGTESCFFFKLPLHQQYGALNQQSLATREGQGSFWTLKKGLCSGENVKWFQKLQSQN